MSSPVTTSRTTCPVCGDIDAEVSFEWSARGDTTSRRPVVTEFTCRNGCSLDDEERPAGPYGPTTVDVQA
jgi:hypothetical protein